VLVDACASGEFTDWKKCNCAVQIAAEFQLTVETPTLDDAMFIDALTAAVKRREPKTDIAAFGKMIDALDQNGLTEAVGDGVRYVLATVVCIDIPLGVD
jgi:hypothetical protein